MLKLAIDPNTGMFSAVQASHLFTVAQENGLLTLRLPAGCLRARQVALVYTIKGWRLEGPRYGADLILSTEKVSRATLMVWTTPDREELANVVAERIFKHMFMVRVGAEKVGKWYEEAPAGASCLEALEATFT